MLRMMQRFGGVCVATVAMCCMGSFANIASAQPNPNKDGRVVAAETVELPKLELHGFLHGEGGGPMVPFGVKRLWLIGDARPHEAVRLRVMTNLVGPDGKPMRSWVASWS